MLVCNFSNFSWRQIPPLPESNSLFLCHPSDSSFLRRALLQAIYRNRATVSLEKYMASYVHSVG